MLYFSSKSPENNVNNELNWHTLAKNRTLFCQGVISFHKRCTGAGEVRQPAPQSKLRELHPKGSRSLQRSTGPFVYRSLCLLCAGSSKLQNNRLFAHLNCTAHAPITYAGTSVALFAPFPSQPSPESLQNHFFRHPCVT